MISYIEPKYIESKCIIDYLMYFILFINPTDRQSLWENQKINCEQTISGACGQTILRRGEQTWLTR